MLPAELGEGGDDIQVLGNHLFAAGIQPPAPDFPIVTQNKLVHRTALAHVIIIVYIVEGDNQGLFPLGQHQLVAHHARLAVFAGYLRPYGVNVHQHIVVFIEGF
ncbi:hypothetical protein SDC9_125826 [bioreactor metagenome]|uniref:Uncharacterized protein n=1 Tax=bioreactor metagenome TaxID=1076179 RepID=A0A645CPH6_9ZZZZ